MTKDEGPMADTPRDIDPEQFIDTLLANNPNRAELKYAIIQMISAAIEQAQAETAPHSQADLHPCILKLGEAMATLQTHKPKTPSELARRYAVAITELEKVIAYFSTYVVFNHK
jgi:hypothetical protein